MLYGSDKVFYAENSYWEQKVRGRQKTINYTIIEKQKGNNSYTRTSGSFFCLRYQVTAARKTYYITHDSDSPNLLQRFSRYQIYLTTTFMFALDFTPTSPKYCYKISTSFGLQDN